MRLLIVGAGMMGGAHATCFGAIDGVTLAGAVDVREGVLAAFCERHGVKDRFASVGEALAKDGFDAACVVTSDDAHHGSTMPLLAAGKHVLCEKPLAPRYGLAREMADAAVKAGVTNMVNLTYRKSRALAKARELVGGGALGEVRHVEASYLQSWLTQDAWGKWSEDPTWLWRLSKAHGSLGVLGDVGVHLIDFMSHATGLEVAELGCDLQTFRKAGGDRIGEYVLDANDSVSINARLGNGALCVMHATRYATGHHNTINLRVHGLKGGLKVEYTNSPGETDTLAVCAGDEANTAAKWSEVELDDVPTVMESFAENVMEGKRGDPDFSHAATLQKVIDTAFAADAKGARLKV